jgi:hypothetical protein
VSESDEEISDLEMPDGGMGFGTLGARARLLVGAEARRRSHKLRV